MTLVADRTEQAEPVQESTPWYVGMLSARLLREINKLAGRFPGRRRGHKQLDTLAWGRYYLSDEWHLIKRKLFLGRGFWRCCVVRLAVGVAWGGV